MRPNARLVRGQISVPEKSNEITATQLLDPLAETARRSAGHHRRHGLCQATIADKIVEHEADRLLALKSATSPRSEADIAAYFSSAPQEQLVIKHAEIEKGGMAVSKCEPSIGSSLAGVTPAGRRFTNANAVVTVVESADRCTFETRFLYLIARSRYRQARQRSAQSLWHRAALKMSPGA